MNMSIGDGFAFEVGRFLGGVAIAAGVIVVVVVFAVISLMVSRR